MKILKAVLATSFVALGGCTEAKKAPKAPSAPAPAQAAKPSSQPSKAWQPATTEAARPGTPGVSGKVAETMNSGGYTYVLIDTGANGKVWAAGPNTAVKVGDTVGFTGGSEMRGFVSKTLNRTFETIYFVGALKVAGAAAPAPAAASQPAPSAAASQPAAKKAASQPAAAPVKAGDVKKAEGGLTVAEVFAQATALSGKQVVLRGKVVKYNGGIMGKNWLHIQDGTGAAGTNDLTVTTDSVAAVGDVVMVKGVLTTNKDFGSGYKYAVLVENASISK